MGFLPDDVVSFQLVDAESVLVRREALRDQEKTASVPKPDATLTDFLESLSPKEQHPVSGKAVPEASSKTGCGRFRLRK